MELIQKEQCESSLVFSVKTRARTIRGFIREFIKEKRKGYVLIGEFNENDILARHVAYDVKKIPKEILDKKLFRVVLISCNGVKDWYVEYKNN